MADNYDSQFNFLLEDIRMVSQHAADNLVQIDATFGARAAYYAAFVIVCLEARGKQSNYRIVATLTPEELTNFTYFEYTKDTPQAVTAFSEVLASYQADCKRRLSLDQNSPASV